MKPLILLFCGLLMQTPATAQHRGVSVQAFLQVSRMDLIQSEGWLFYHHFVLIKEEKTNGVQRQTYLSDQPDAQGDHDALLMVFGRVTSPPQYMSYSTNHTRFDQFRRALSTCQFYTVDAYRDTLGNGVIQYRNEGDVIELTTLWSPPIQGNLYSISFVPANRINVSNK